ncbi:MAG: type II secretion system protein GspF [Desulfobulbaceae bacterium]|nr:MAG: type II secretion system protein GspF [Desulfobulbaceae bacterium]
MPIYQYKALLRDGKKISGLIDADSDAAARMKLRAGGKYPTLLERVQDYRDGALASGKTNLPGFRPVSTAEIAILTRQLATLLGAGVPLDATLESIIEQSSNQKLKQILAGVREGVSDGLPLSLTLAKHPRCFNQLYVNMVRAGEFSGALGMVMKRLADYQEHREELKGRIRSALSYPLFMALFSIGVVWVLLSFIVPDIVNLFSDVEKSLPLPTQLLISISSYFQNYWWLTIIMVGALALLVTIGRNHAQTGAIFDYFKTRIPVIGRIILKSTMARFAHALENLMRGGVPLLDSLSIAKEITDNRLIINDIEKAIEAMERGKGMAEAFSASPWFTPLFIQMVSVGESTGKLEDMLNTIYQAELREAEASIRTMINLIEPVMIIIMGTIVCFIVLSILLPIFEMSRIVG